MLEATLRSSTLRFFVRCVEYLIPPQETFPSVDPILSLALISYSIPHPKPNESFEQTAEKAKKKNGVFESPIALNIADKIYKMKTDRVS